MNLSNDRVSPRNVVERRGISFRGDVYNLRVGRMQTRVRAGCVLVSFAFFLDPGEMVVTEPQTKRTFIQSRGGAC